MYKNTVRWRREFGTDQIHKTFSFPEKKEVLKIFPQYYLRTDKFGRPIYINEVGKINVEALLRVTTVERMIQYHVYEWEKLIREIYPKCSAHVGHKIFQSFSIIDLKGLSYKQFNKTTRSFLKQITNIDQEYYPEHLGQMFIINAPKIFSMIWSVVKLWLDKRTLAKIKVYGSDYHEKLFNFVDPHDLPEHIGGHLDADEAMFSTSNIWDASEMKEALKDVVKDSSPSPSPSPGGNGGGGELLRERSNTDYFDAEPTFNEGD
ncbi:CRAL-TRIO lipid binding domain-containing protein [Chloropicon primus]|nr:CRAL-TRIO lipid binding domain-containing protein [Chloropicon primus]